MATIVVTKEGSWRAVVRRKGKYASKTFRLKGSAQEWARDTEYNIDKGGEVSTPISSKMKTLGQLIDLHVSDLHEVGKPIRRSKQAVLDALKRDLGQTALRNLNRSTLITYGKKRAKDGAGPVTLSVDLSYIGTVLNHAKAHLQLRASLAKAGGRLESPSIEFGEDSDSILVENLLASVAQHQREKNGEQTKNRMRARMQNGYWVFGAPIGYKFETQSGHGKILVRDEPVASILADAMTRYATGRLASQMEVKRFLDANPTFTKSRTTKLHQSRIADLFSRPIYAGYLTHENWGLSLIPAKHEPLINYETFLAIQKRGAVTAYAPTRKDLNEDFPLRGFVTCGHCDKPMTA